jgi:hypothetical protein
VLSFDLEMEFAFRFLFKGFRLDISLIVNGNSEIVERVLASGESPPFAVRRFEVSKDTILVTQSNLLCSAKSAD